MIYLFDRDSRLNLADLSVLNFEDLINKLNIKSLVVWAWMNFANNNVLAKACFGLATVIVLSVISHEELPFFFFFLFFQENTKTPLEQEVRIHECNL